MRTLKRNFTIFLQLDFLLIDVCVGGFDGGLVLGMIFGQMGNNVVASRWVGNGVVTSR
jgi:hypothetical protein